MPEGRITRGTTGTNRLRRVDRWIAASPALRDAESPLVVDLGYGAAPWTVLELADRLARVRSDIDVIGIEIDPERVAVAAPYRRPGLDFVRGGFEVPLPRGRRATVIRAMNVLRQYKEDEVAAAWARLSSRIDDGGLVVDGTSNEVGRIASWVALDTAGPQSFTISLRLDGLERPGIVEERLPKALIHRNVPGERIHDLVTGLDEQWARAAGYGEFGAVQRWLHTVDGLRENGWPVLGDRRRWRLGELTVPWTAVAPLD
ncbi:class I SAM-dependent methyltransferase [Amnibacterium flavum]|nr:class I SAM-dependent methyltransferase [Amnibacterium flavum]